MRVTLDLSDRISKSVTDSAGKSVKSDDFARIIFQDNNEEDLLDYEPSALQMAAQFALDALSFYSDLEPLIMINTDIQCKRREISVITIVNRNSPFLLDSAMNVLADKFGQITLVAHPVLSIQNKSDTIVLKTDSSGQSNERVSLIQIHVPKLSAEQASELTAELYELYRQVRAVVDAWPLMLAQIEALLNSYVNLAVGTSEPNVAEVIGLLEWLVDNHFTFIGLKKFELTSEEGSVSHWCLTEKNGIFTIDRLIDDPSPDGPVFATLDDNWIEFSKTSQRTKVHRNAYLDVISIKIPDDQGRLVGAFQVTGLFTASVYSSPVMQIPYLRNKALYVKKALGLNGRDHSGKVLTRVLDAYPRDELFQISSDKLAENCRRIIELEERPRVRAFLRDDPLSELVTVITFIPRDRYDTRVREKISDYFSKIFNGEVAEFHPTFLSNGLTRVYFIIHRKQPAAYKVEQRDIEAEINKIVTNWEDGVRECAAISENPVADDIVQMAINFPQSYREIFTPKESLIDAGHILKLSPENPFAIDFYRYRSDGINGVSLMIYHYGSPVVLSKRVPLLENMGFNVISEQTYELPEAGKDGSVIYVHDMQLDSAFDQPVDLSDGGAMLDDLFCTVWNGLADDDAYNALVQSAKLPARKIMVLRAYGRYLQQVGISYSQDIIAGALNKFPHIAASLYELFDVRLNPDQLSDAAAEKKLSDTIETALQDVPNIDDDLILRRIRNLIESTLRCNIFQPDAAGNLPNVFAFKFDPQLIEGMPEPKPYREIFVYGTEVEGVHLRFGAVARGGLRWSDRGQDYRTEVLGLVKAQQVKNSVIVPAGAKGGFYPKKLPVGGDRTAIFEAGRDAYKTFISTMVDITDNIDQQDVIAPNHVKRHDGNDPYFVVAADKGTATFSDTANAISQAHDFWLDDAFASGGSAGYDHKGMAITARGGWEAVKRHFREQDIDIQTQPVTVVGVGDMSGDVFGNGMLCSKKLKLVAAFDHRDIFIDPEPDPAISFAERQRLFNVPRSSWQDYDLSKFSKGGGVYSRNQKIITISQEAADAIGVSETKLTPNELIQAILRAPVDLLWFGGIGTYIRGSSETDAKVGDRANDAIRIAGNEVRAKVIGEGANLGMTQFGRIEYGLNGGRGNTDAIDNSGGVNCSDVEVNIKIALASAMQKGKINREERNVLLSEMTSEVARLVLRNNYLQPLALSLEELRGVSELSHQARFMGNLEKKKLLDRRIENLPRDAELKERRKAGQSLTRPELAILMAHAKLFLTDALLKSDLVDDPYFEGLLFSYFPKQMAENYAEEIKAHRLRREIIATLLANDVVNRGGITFVNRLKDVSGKSEADVIRAYIAIRDGFAINPVYDEIDALDNKISGSVQNDLYALVSKMLNETTAWVLRNDVPGATLAELTQAVSHARQTLEPQMELLLLPSLLQEQTLQREAFVALGTSANLAEKLAQLQNALIIPDIALIAHQAQAEIVKTAKTHFALKEALCVSQIEAAIRLVSSNDYYDGLAIVRARDMVEEAVRNISVKALAEFANSANPGEAYIEAHADKFEKLRQSLLELTASEDVTLGRIVIASSIIWDLTK